MEISYFTAMGNFNPIHGFAIAGMGIVLGLQSNGVAVPFNSPTSPMQLNFSQPLFYERHIRPEQHSIGLTVWESTKVPEDWSRGLNKVSEIWTASHWNRRILEDNGYKVTKVFPHGVSPEFTPHRRTRGNTLRFLHDGADAYRKGAEQAYGAFRAAFGDRTDVELVFKAKRSEHVTVQPASNVKVICEQYSLSQMVDLYHNSDVMICNSYGEGFGLPGLQALASGMPTIITQEWCEYADFSPELLLDSEYINSPWIDIHPGQVCQPNFDNLVSAMQQCDQHIERLSDTYYGRASKVHASYDWTRLTKQALNL